MTEAVEDVPPDDGPAPVSDAKHSTRNALEWVGIVVGALVVAILVKTFLIQAFFIPSLSMYSTLDKGDRVLVNKVSYHVHDIHYGDIVVFKRPPKVSDRTINDLIKRVVGLPGDKLEAHGGTLYRNGKKLNEKYLDDGTRTADFGPETVPSGDIWVMGDNRSNSEDSRYFGPIPESSVVGRAFVRVWPIQKFRLL